MFPVVQDRVLRRLQARPAIPEEVEGFLPEFRPFVALCAFPDCTHTHEAKCAVKKAVDRRQISTRRYHSYMGMFTGADDYQTSIPIGDLETPIWLVWKMNGEPVPTRHGAPARILTPGRYGMKNPKWVTEIRFAKEPFLGFWESRGWSNTAEYRANTYFLSPSASAVLTAGPVRFLGTAFAGSDPIAHVEVSTDGGEHWADAEITYQNGPDIWTLWAFDWDAVAGDYQIQVRATTESGKKSALEPNGTDAWGGYNGSMQIDVSVRN